VCVRINSRHAHFFFLDPKKLHLFLTDNPNEIQQPAILPGINVPIENAFPNLNLDTVDIRGPRTDIRNQ
jgi:hypothetical protein